MFEELYEPLPDVSQTLKRIGLDNYKPRLDVESLNNLIRAFKSHIPFENLSIWYERKVPSLAPADLYDKMVVRRRGRLLL